jgi:uncharacterized OB-fold protein
MSEAKTGKKRLPLRRGGFIVPEDPKLEPYLVASKCGNCGKYFSPPRVICLNCEKQQMEPAALSGKGTVYSYTIVHQQLPFSVVQVPYAIVIVALAEGCQTHGVVSENLELVEVGAPIEVYFEKVREDDEGNDLIVNKFRIVQK